MSARSKEAGTEGELRTSETATSGAGVAGLTNPGTTGNVPQERVEVPTTKRAPMAERVNAALGATFISPEVRAKLDEALAE